MILVHVPLVLDVEPSGAPDAINELLRAHQACFQPGSCLIDYAVPSLATRIEIHPEAYAEGEAFIQI